MGYGGQQMTPDSCFGPGCIWHCHFLLSLQDRPFEEDEVALEAWLGEPQALPQLSSRLHTAVPLQSHWHLHPHHACQDPDPAQPPSFEQ